MPLLAYFLLLFCFLFTGYGILCLFHLRMKAAYTITLSLLLGLAVASFIPFLLQLFYIEINPVSIFGTLTVACLLINYPQWEIIFREGFAAFRRSLPRASFKVRPYELPFWAIIGFLVFVSIWRCYYLPPTSRDVLSGPEAIADVAFHEHTLINSFFSVDLWSTNNQFKSPFLISLQLLYKMAGFPFGQVWLSVVFVSITVFLYHALRERLHPFLAGLLLLLFIMTPEMYAYTFMILYDYSNMVYFFLSLYFLFEWCRDSATGRMAEGQTSDAGVRGLDFAQTREDSGQGGRPQFYFAGLLMGIATYIRSETLALALLFLPLILLLQWRRKTAVKKLLPADGLFLLPSVIGYLLPSEIYIKYYLPVHYDIGGLVNGHLGSIQPLFQRYGDIVTKLIVGDFGIHLWGYIFFLAAFLFLAELTLVRRFNRDARNWLYAIVVVYLGLGALGWLLPMMNLNETTKRAMFKLLPLVLFYMANNQLLIRLSAKITKWEEAPGRAKAPAPVKTVLSKTGKAIPASAAPAKTGPGKKKKK
jgi:hypothetical protein